MAAVAKRRNPFGESSLVLKATRTDEIDMAQVYEATLRKMHAGAVTAHMQPPTAPSTRVASCWCCAQSCHPTDCSACTRPVCQMCVRQCDMCCETFCGFCTMTNYDMWLDRTFCLDCTAEEKRRARAAAALAAAQAADASAMDVTEASPARLPSSSALRPRV